MTNLSSRSMPSVLMIVGILFVSFSMIAHGVDTSFGRVSIRLYVLDLSGVTGQGVTNMNQAVQGVLEAARVSQSAFVASLSPFSVGNIDLEMNISLINDWTAYKTLIESDSNYIIVNAHGETLPVPADYSSSRWVTKIAEALAYRNVTWVHTALYPFYYVYDQASGESTWGEEGFKEFMSFIELNNITCWPTPPGHEQDLSDIGDAVADSVGFAWLIQNALYAERGRPLHASDFQNYTVVPLDLWSFGVDYPGAVIKFARSTDTSSFGFYVHIGTNQTSQTSQFPYVKVYDDDYMHGYIGTAIAIWSVSLRVSSEIAISDAETAITNAENQGRTSGLGLAENYFQSARKSYYKNDYRLALLNAEEAKTEAGIAVRPQPSLAQTSFILPAMIVLSVSIGTTGLVLRRRHRKNKEL